MRGKRTADAEVVLEGVVHLAAVLEEEHVSKGVERHDVLHRDSARIWERLPCMTSRLLRLLLLLLILLHLLLIPLLLLLALLLLLLLQLWLLLLQRTMDDDSSLEVLVDARVPDTDALSSTVVEQVEVHRIPRQ